MTTTESTAAARERGRLVAAAVNAGKIPADRAPYWLSEMKRDPDRTKAVLASLAPVLADRATAASSQHYMGANPVRRALDTGAPPLPPAQPDRSTRTVSLGGGLVQMQAELIAGKPRDQWTEQEGRDWLLWNLGPRFRRGLKPPPEPQWFIPTESVSHTTNMRGM
jgi:hypothetical protein